jgi:type I restriction enzyme S subunit
MTAKDIVNNKIDFKECRYISTDEHRQLTKRVKPMKGDVLLTKVGTVGNVALVWDEPEFSIFVQIALIKPDLSKVDSRYLKNALMSEAVQREISDKSAQSTMKFIGVQRIANIYLPLPPIVEQNQIAEFLSAIDNKIEAEETKKDSLESLFKTLLSLLMTGKIRVKDLDV